MPLDKVAFYGAGWQLHAEDLAAYLAGRTVPTPRSGSASSSRPIRTRPLGLG